MRLNLLTLVILSAVLGACVDEGVIGNQTDHQTAQVGGGSSSTNTANAGQSPVATGGNISTANGGRAATGGRSQAGSTATSPEGLAFDATTTRCGITTTSAATSKVFAIPADPFNAEPAAMWQPLVTACRDGGWDLARCAAEDVIIMSAVTNEKSGTILDLPVSVNVYLRGADVCCVTRTTDANGTPAATPCPQTNAAAKALNACGIAAPQSNSLELDVPSSLTGPNWSIKAEACTTGGWDLAACAGDKATFTSFDLGNTGTEGRALTAWVVTKNDRVCCIYESEEEVAPGIVPVSCPK
jgi:hypothetical protein